MKKQINIGLLGLGTVGSGVVQVLQQNGAKKKKKVGCPLNISKILVRDINKRRDEAVAPLLTTDAAAIINDPDIDIVVEVIGGEYPAKDYIVQALQAGKHVVTANKDVIAKHGKELFAVAAANRRDLLFEGSVGGGIPIIRPLKQCLAANNITKVMGIVNGTTNYMLTRMTKERMEFAEALAQAQALGYAEADPSSDVGGLDAARKLAILASIAFNSRVSLDDVYIEGIEKVSLRDIEYAHELGYVIKLLAIAKHDHNGISVRVHPAFIPATHPLASVNDVYNAIYIQGDAVGETMFYGQGAGKLPTASAVVGDIIDVARDIQHNVSSRILCTCYNEIPICSIDQVESPYYIRLIVEDKPGVLAAIAGAFGAQQVSLHSVIQKRRIGKNSEIVLITYRVADASLRLAINTLAGMSVVCAIRSIIRVEAEDID